MAARTLRPRVAEGQREACALASVQGTISTQTLHPKPTGSRGAARGDMSWMTRRLFPPAPTIVREAARDCEVGGYPVRRGQWLGCAVYSMHRNPKYWQARRPAAMHTQEFYGGP